MNVLTTYKNFVTRAGLTQCYYEYYKYLDYFPLDEHNTPEEFNSLLEGSWFFLELCPREKGTPGPLAWTSPLEQDEDLRDGYPRDIPLTLKKITFIAGWTHIPLQEHYLVDLRKFHIENELPSDILIKTSQLEEACSFAERENCDSKVIKLLSKLPPIHAALVRDVGQGSFISLVDHNNKEIIHLDAGWPIGINKHTAPRSRSQDGRQATPTFPTFKNPKAPVIMSHWDWDHIHSYHHCSNLRKVPWIVPIQQLGPNTKRIEETLRSRGLLFTIDRNISCGNIEIYKNNENARMRSKNKNNSGLITIATLYSGKKLLYVGDSNYVDCCTRSPDLLIATHHGARFKGQVPPPHTSNAWCAISVGKNNKYKHPSVEATRSHSQAGWRLLYTCARENAPRGMKRLPPG